MNTEAQKLINAINALDFKNRATASLKAGLRNINQDCKDQGFTTSGALIAANRFLNKHKKV